MQFDKQQIIDLLRNFGDHDKAGQAEAELPDQVDTDQHASLLDKIGINPSQLLGGGSGDDQGGLGGLAGKIGL